jgi:hypothetical protein
MSVTNDTPIRKDESWSRYITAFISLQQEKNSRYHLQPNVSNASQLQSDSGSETVADWSHMKYTYFSWHVSQNHLQIKVNRQTSSCVLRSLGVRQKSAGNSSIILQSNLKFQFCKLTANTANEMRVLMTMNKLHLFLHSGHKTPITSK